MRKGPGSEARLSLWEWPGVSYVLVLAIALPVIVEEMVDIVALLFGNAAPAPRYYGTISGYWLQLPAIALCIFSLSRIGANGLYAVLLGAISSLLIVINFRSSVIRPGTFDFFEEHASWKLPLFLGIGVGCVAAILVAPRVIPSARSIQQMTLVTLIGLVIVTSVSLWTCVLAPTISWSEFAPTRHIVLSGIAVVCVGSFAAAKWSERQNEEEYGLHPN